MRRTSWLLLLSGCFQFEGDGEPAAVDASCAVDADCGEGLCAPNGTCQSCRPEQRADFHPDRDGDGRGDASPTAETRALCEEVPGWVAPKDDCDDNDKNRTDRSTLACARACADGAEPLADCPSSAPGALRLELGEEGNENFGQLIAPADFDGDGSIDLALHSFDTPLEGPCAAEEAGCGRVVFAWGPFDGQEPRIAEGPHVHGYLPNRRLGRALVALGDLDGDGRSELGVGMSFGESMAGKAQVWFGRPRSDWAVADARLAERGRPDAAVEFIAAQSLTFGAAPAPELVLLEQAAGRVVWFPTVSRELSSIDLNALPPDARTFILAGVTDDVRGDARFDFDGDGVRDLVLAGRTSDVGRAALVRGPLEAYPQRTVVQPDEQLELTSGGAFAGSFAVRRAADGLEIWIGDYLGGREESVPDAEGKPTPHKRGRITILRWEREAVLVEDGAYEGDERDFGVGYRILPVPSSEVPASDAIVLASASSRASVDLGDGALHVLRAATLDARASNELLGVAGRRLRIEGTRQTGVALRDLDCPDLADCGGLDLVLARYENPDNAITLRRGILDAF